MIAHGLLFRIGIDAIIFNEPAGGLGLSKTMGKPGQRALSRGRAGRRNEKETRSRPKKLITFARCLMNHVPRVIPARELLKEFQIHRTVNFFDRLRPVGSRSYGSEYVAITSRTSKQDPAQVVERCFQLMRRASYSRGCTRYVRTRYVF